MMATCRVATAGPATMAHNWAIFHFGAGPALGKHDGAVIIIVYYAIRQPHQTHRGGATMLYTVQNIKAHTR